MNRLILTESDRVENDSFIIKDSFRLTHLSNVLKIKNGDLLKVTLLNQSLGKAKVIEFSEAECLVRVIEMESVEVTPDIQLQIALSRPPTCKKILEHGTSMGAKGIEFFQADLSEKSYLDSKIFENEKYKEYLHLGLAQSAIYFEEPSFKLSKSFEKSNIEQRFFLSVKEASTFQKVALDFTDPIVLSIGPERGFTQREEKGLLEAGYKPICLGPSVLRVEIATFSALGQLQMLNFQNQL
jgi:16S rRNA (uracil1498-N3)-methyltransferase